MLLDDCVGMCVTDSCEVGIDDVSESYDVLEPCDGGWDGRRRCAGGGWEDVGRIDVKMVG